jgi:hypothetical protein
MLMLSGKIDLPAATATFNNSIMPISLPISKMSKADKLRAIEDLWTSLTADSAAFNPPAWHKAALLETEKRVKSGLETFIDWEKAKTSLRRRAK